MKSYLKCLIALFAITTMSTVFSQPPCTDSSRECVIKVATTYLDALLTRDPSHVSLADNAQRWENGINTGMGADDIRFHLQYKDFHVAISGMRDIRWMVDGDQAIAYYLLDIVIPYTSIHYGTTHVVEKFKITQGKIEDIEAIFCTSTNPKPESSRIPAPTSLSILCNRV